MIDIQIVTQGSADMVRDLIQTYNGYATLYEKV